MLTILDHNTTQQSEYNLVWRVLYFKDSTMFGIVDAHSEDILSLKEPQDDQIDAPTATYNTQWLFDRDIGTTRTLQTQDEKIFVFNFNTEALKMIGI